MRTEKVLVEQEVFYSDDGHKCATREEARRRDEDFHKRQNGTRRKCSRCGGTGRIHGRYEKYFDGGMYGDHQYHEHYVSDKCPDCDGKGYQDLKEVWE